MTVAQRRIQRPITYDLDSGVAGHWRIIARGHRGRWRDITRFRGIPTTLQTMSFSDPYGPRDLTFTVPNVTLYDQLGTGDLSWADEDMRIAVQWVNPVVALPTSYPFGYGIYTLDEGIVGTAGYAARQQRFLGWSADFDWKGDLAARTRSSDGLSLTFKGALYGLDNYLSKPEYPIRPLPYEVAIARQFRRKPHLRLGGLKIAWPTWWTKRYTPPGKKTPHYLVPAGVH